MDLNEAKSFILNTTSSLSPNDRQSLLIWMKNWTSEEESGNGTVGSLLADVSNDDKILESIKSDLRQSLPLNAMSPSENVIHPVVGQNADCDASTTVHVDAFLYDDDAVDELCDQEKMSRNYCKRCGSHDVAPLTFISHSMSHQQLKYVFQYVLPDLSGKTLVDVGSRLGIVLYSTHVYTSAAKIVGIEMNSHFCELQNTVITKYGMQDRISVLCADVCTQKDVMVSADVVVLNNVFEFFIPHEEQAKVWNFLHQTIRKSGTILVVVPSLEDSLEHLEVDFDVNTWLRPIQVDEQLMKASKELFGSDDSDNSDLSSIYFYQV